MILSRISLSFIGEVDCRGDAAIPQCAWRVLRSENVSGERAISLRCEGDKAVILRMFEKTTLQGGEEGGRDVRDTRKMSWLKFRYSEFSIDFSICDIHTPSHSSYTQIIHKIHARTHAYIHITPRTLLSPSGWRGAVDGPKDAGQCDRFCLFKIQEIQQNIVTLTSVAHGYSLSLSLSLLFPPLPL